MPPTTSTTGVTLPEDSGWIQNQQC